MEVGAIAIFVLLGLSSASAGRIWTQGTKIVGGVETTIEDVPYQLQLERGLLNIIWSFSCGAVIVGPDAVVTAGHCVVGETPSSIRFRSGDKNRGSGTIHTVAELYLHPNYTEIDGYADYDIGVARVTPPFQFGATTQAISLVEVAPKAGDNATVSGWGTTSENNNAAAAVVRKVVVPVIDRDTCATDYADAFITTNMICAGFDEGGKDSCSGDSGGPFIIDNKVAGLVSWGEGCARPSRPGVYTNVLPFVPWIKETLKLN